MSAPEQLENFYNNSDLSDVKIKQITGDQVREYFGHKVVLARSSKYFANMITGQFKEASTNEIELHGDDPEAFEAFLRAVYAGEYRIKTSFGVLKEPVPPIVKAIKVWEIVDKYMVANVTSSIGSEMSSATGDLEFGSFRDYKAVVEAFYKLEAVEMGTRIGLEIADVIVHESHLACHEDLEPLVKAYPMFAADVGLLSVRRGERD